MTISHAGYNFDGLTTHQTPDVEPWEFADVRGQFPAVLGESEVRDQPKGRTIRVECMLKGYNSFADLEEFLRELDTKINELIGTLTITGATYEACTFKGFEHAGRAFQDGSGVHGWMIEGALVWRQLKRNVSVSS